MEQIRYILPGKRSKKIIFASSARDGPRIREPVNGHFLMKEFGGSMKKAILTVVLAVAVLVPVSAQAAGTAAGTNITNKATATYNINGNNITADSNITTVKVAEIINVTATWQDASNIPAYPGDSNKVLTYKVSNTGNGREGFVLSANVAVAGDDFNPALSGNGIYLDANGNGIYDSGTDTLYTAGTNDPNLTADGYVTVFVLCNIPSGLSDGNLGFVNLTATSKTSGGAVAAGTVYVGGGDGGVDAVMGGSGGSSTQTGKYQVAVITVSVVKSAAVSDRFGGTKPVPGATIQYTITVTVAGTGTAAGVVITDPVPANTTYAAGTLRLNGTAISDAKDADAGDVGGTTAGIVSVSLGDLTSSSAVQSITFDVKIN